MRAVFAEPEPPPLNATSDSTAGSSPIVCANCESSRFICCDDVSWSAWIVPLRRPVSCCGKKPLGTMMYSQTVKPMVPSVTSSVMRWWRSTQPSVRS